MNKQDSLAATKFVRIVGAMWVVLSLLAARAATADAFSYASQRRQIKACVLVTSDADGDGDLIGDLTDYAPFFFYVLDRRTDLKPAGWEFLNPLAPSSITPDLYAYMKKRGGNNDPTLNSPSVQVNAPLTKNLSAYWTVHLDKVTISDLRRFDVALMTLRRTTNSPAPIRLSAESVQKLHAFVDGGGTLMLEDEGGTGGTFVSNDSNQNFLFPIGFNSGGGNLPAFTNRGSQTHPLVSFPFPISAFDVARLGANGGGNFHFDGNNNGNSPNARFVAPVILSSGGRPYVSAGDYGAGHIVVSSAGIATAINSYIGGVTLPVYGGNSGAVSGDNLLAADTTNLKFAYNLIGWTSSVSSSANNSRRSGGSPEDINSDLGKKWETVPLGFGGQPNPTNSGSGATIYKGAVFFVDGANVLHAYNARPGNPLDGARNPDLGVPDFGLGYSYDEIWRQQLPGNFRYSTPTLVQVNTNNGPRDLVIVTSGNGVTRAYDALPRNNRGRLQNTTIPRWVVQGDTGFDVTTNALTFQQIPAPAFSDGVVFAIFGNGALGTSTPWRVAAIDPLTGNSIFDNQPYNGTNFYIAPSPSMTAAQPGLSPISGPLTVGFIKDRQSGAIDKFIYAATQPSTLPLAAGTINPILFSVRHEPLFATNASNQDWQARGNRGHIPWFVPQQNNGNIELQPVLHLVDTNTNVNPVTVTYSDIPRSLNSFQVNMNQGTAGTIVHFTNPPNAAGHIYELYADYWVDWAGAQGDSGTPNSQDMQFALKDLSSQFHAFDTGQMTKSVQLTGAPALTADDLLIFNTNNSQDQGNALSVGAGNKPTDRVYAFRHQFSLASSQGNRRDSAEVAWMWSPVSGSTGLASGVASTVRPRLFANDTALATTGTALTNFVAYGSPAVSNGVAYVVGITNTNVTVVLALNANPSTTFNTGQQFIPGTVIKLKQPNLTNSTSNVIGGDSYIELDPGNVALDNNTGTVTIFNFKTGSGDAFNTALPIYVEVNGTVQPNPIINPVTGYGPLDNLLWYMVLPPNLGFQNAYNNNTIIGTADNRWNNILPASGPTVTGSALYFGTQDGRVVSVTLSGLTGGAQAPLFNQNSNKKFDLSQPNFHVQETLLNPNNGSVLANNAITSPPAAGGGLVVAGTPYGAVGLENLTTLITDNTRLLEVNHANEIVWEMSATRSRGLAGGDLPLFTGGANPANAARATGRDVAQRISLAGPNMAHRTSLSDFIVADTDNSRIVVFDKSGTISVEIAAFNNGMKVLRPGDPLTLNHPTDVQVFTESELDPNDTTQFANRDTGVVYTVQAPYVLRRYTIADSGNYRAIEVVTVLDTNLRPKSAIASDGSGPVVMQNQVVFVTRSLAEQNAKYRYRTIQQFFDPTSFSLFMIAAIDNARIATVDAAANGSQAFGAEKTTAEGPGGSLLVIKRTFNTPEDGNVVAAVSSIAFVDNNGNVVRHQPINNPTWFKEYTIRDPKSGLPVPRYLLADANGVYELNPGVPTAPGEAVVTWMMTADDYLYLTGRPLRAASIQRLPQTEYDSNTNQFYPHYLITNRYSGPDNVPEVYGFGPGVPHGTVKGEVVEVRSIVFFRNGGTYFGNANSRLYKSNNNGWLALNDDPNRAIEWMSPAEVIPTTQGAIKRRLGSPSGAVSASLFELPTFSDRPF